VRPVYLPLTDHAEASGIEVDVLVRAVERDLLPGTLRRGVLHVSETDFENFERSAVRAYVDAAEQKGDETP
jgi:hypothetical protein